MGSVPELCESGGLRPLGTPCSVAEPAGLPRGSCRAFFELWTVNCSKSVESWEVTRMETCLLHWALPLMDECEMVLFAGNLP